MERRGTTNGTAAGARRATVIEVCIEFVSVALAGVVVGIATQRSQMLSPAAGAAFAASTGPWAILAALLGRRARCLPAAIAYTTTFLLVATIAYYEAGGPIAGGGTPIFWLVVVAVIGPVLGLLGRLSTLDTWAGALATGAIAGWLAGEAIYTALRYPGEVGWLGVAINLVAMAGWVVTTRGPRKLVAATLLPMSTAPALFLAAANTVSASGFH